MFTPKFKAWDKKLGRWFDADDSEYEQEHFFGLLIDDEGILSCYRDDFGEAGLFLSDTQGMQLSDRFKLFWFTGHKDKNGVEIYDGDIVGGESFEGNDFVVHQSREGYVIQQNGEWLFDFADSLEVIGNIHDNPELLEANRD
jgi:uncharacterized phage protein (TIGR01671 family)